MADDPNDLGALAREFDPDGSLAKDLAHVAGEHERQGAHAAAARRRGELPAHEWVFVPLIPIELRDANALARGERRVWTVDVQDTKLRGGAVFCTRCQVSYSDMTDVERLGCAAPADDDDE